METDFDSSAKKADCGSGVIKFTTQNSENSVSHAKIISCL